MTFAIVPAAGQSARMGRPKLALPIGDRTVLEFVVAALRGGGIEHVLVVVGPHVPELAPLATTAGAEILCLPEPTSNMRTTVEHGLRWLEERYRPRPDDYWVLAPGDHPSFGAGVVKALVAVAGTGGKTIVVPVHGGRRGHPTVIAWRHVGGICALAREEGINSYLRTHGAETMEVPVADAGILDDLDTPADLDRLRARM